MKQLRSDAPRFMVEHDGKAVTAWVDDDEIVVSVRAGIFPFVLRIPPQLARRLHDWLGSVLSDGACGSEAPEGGIYCARPRGHTGQHVSGRATR